MKRNVAIVLSLCAGCAFADEPRHLQLAQQFDALSGSSNKAALATAVVPEFVRADPSLAPHEEELKTFYVNMMESEEYRLGKARVYMEIFSEAELEQLIALVQSPAYQILQSKRNQMTALLMRSATDIAAKKLPEFKKTLERK